MKVSRVVLIVVALHVLVIGGIFVFEGCSRAKAPVSTASETLPGDETPAATAAALPAAQTPDATAPANMTPASPTTPAVATTTPVEARTYVVKKGDTLIKIAKSQSVKIGDLSRANNLTKTSMLKVGQKLQIPAAARTESTEMASASTGSTATGAKGTATTALPGADSSGSMYLVKSGDSLWKIAHSQNVTVAAVKQANSLSSDALKVGQKLHIPAASPSTAAASNVSATPVGNTPMASASSSDWQPGPVTVNGQQFHIVDIGESPAIIAKKYGVKTDDLMKANNISDAKHIFVGQKLVIPTGQTAPPAAAATAPTSTTSATPAVAAPIVSMNH